MNTYRLKFAILLVAQVLLWNYVDFSQYIILCILPTMVLCLPIRYGAISAMLVAFALGFIVDFMGSGQIGLCSVALVPVAFLRRTIISLVIGPEVSSRSEELSYKRQGWRKLGLAVALVTALFTMLYICIDSAFMRPIWVDVLKWLLSLLLSSLCSLYVVKLLSEEGNSKWR